MDTARSERTLNQRHRRLRGHGGGEHRASSEGLKKSRREKCNRYWAAVLLTVLGIAPVTARFHPGGGRRERPGRAEFTPRLRQQIGKGSVREPVLWWDNSSARGSPKPGDSDQAVGN